MSVFLSHIESVLVSFHVSIELQEAHCLLMGNSISYVVRRVVARHVDQIILLLKGIVHDITIVCGVAVITTDVVCGTCCGAVVLGCFSVKHMSAMLCYVIL